MTKARQRDLFSSLIVLLCIGVFVVAVWFPARRENSQMMEPSLVAPFGSSATVDGLQWAVRYVEAPPLVSAPADRIVLPGSRVVALRFDSTQNGMPATLGKGRYVDCYPTVEDQRGRRWDSSTLTQPMWQWLDDHNYARTGCGTTNGYIMVTIVPDDAVIEAVDLVFYEPTPEGPGALISVEQRTKKMMVRFLLR